MLVVRQFIAAFEQQLAFLHECGEHLFNAANGTTLPDYDGSHIPATTFHWKAYYGHV